MTPRLHGWDQDPPLRQSVLVARFFIKCSYFRQQDRWHLVNSMPLLFSQMKCWHIWECKSFHLLPARLSYSCICSLTQKNSWADYIWALEDFYYKILTWHVYFNVHPEVFCYHDSVMWCTTFYTHRHASQMVTTPKGSILQHWVHGIMHSTLRTRGT